MADSDFPKPPDVPDYVPVQAVWSPTGTPTYKTTGISGYANEITPDPNPTNLTGWVLPGDYAANNGENGFQTAAQGATQAKMRTHINFTHVLRDDPVRNYGRPGTSHWHTFLGNKSINAWSTYKTVRQNPRSHAAGGPVNATGYWIPSFLVPLNGKTYAKIPDSSTVYYTVDIDPAIQAVIQRLPFGLRYVAGWNMDDHHETAVRAELDASGGSYAPGDPINGFGGWKMYNAANGTYALTDQGKVFSKHLKNADGSDPWEGRATSAHTLIGDINAPEFWDGVNIWSPGGFKHFRHGQHSNATGGIVGPNNWVRVPQLQITFAFTHGGFADYGTWRLSSDDHLGMSGGTHAPMLNGSTFHADWLGGWDQAIMTMWQRNAQGVDGFAPHDMDDSVMSATQRLIRGEAAPDGSRFPQVDLSQRLETTPNKMILLPSSGVGRGPFTVKSRGN